MIKYRKQFHIKHNLYYSALQWSCPGQYNYGMPACHCTGETKVQFPDREFFASLKENHLDNFYHRTQKISTLNKKFDGSYWREYLTLDLKSSVILHMPWKRHSISFATICSMFFFVKRSSLSNFGVLKFSGFVGTEVI